MNGKTFALLFSSTAANFSPNNIWNLQKNSVNLQTENEQLCLWWLYQLSVLQINLGGGDLDGNGTIDAADLTKLIEILLGR